MSNDQTHLYAVAKREILKGGGGAIIFTLFSSVFLFFRKNNLKLIETEKALGGPGAFSPGKILKIYMLNWLKFFDPNSECFVKYNAFCTQVFDVAYWLKA